MKTPQKFISFLAGAAFVVASNLNAATTDPVGYTTISIAAGTTSVPTITVVSLPLYGSADIPGVESGTISGATSSTITIASAGWTPDSLDLDGSPFFLKINTGEFEGSTFLIENNTADTLTLKTDGIDLSGLSGTSDMATIIPGDTVLSAFGTPSDGVVGGTGSSDADVVYLFDGTVWKALYYNNSTSQWEEDGLSFLGSRDDLVIPPTSSIIYQRVGPQYDITTVGAVPVNQVQFPTNRSGVTSAATVIPVDSSLGDLGIQNLPNWRAVGDSGVTPSNADIVYLYDDGIWKGCYYDATTSEWLQPSLEFLGDQSTIPLPVGSGYIVTRAGSGGAENYTLTTPY